MTQGSVQRKKILIPVNVPGQDFAVLENEFKVFRPAEPYRSFSNAEIDELIPEVSGILSTFRVSAERIAAAPKLEIIVANGAGTDNVDIPAASARNVAVVNIPETVTDSTAEHAFALILAASRRIVEHDRELRTETNAAPLFDMGRGKGHNLAGRTLGIFGMGRIGRRLSAFGRAFGMNVIYHNRRPLPVGSVDEAEYVSFDELLRRSDVLSIHSPLNAVSRGIFNRAAFEKMKPEAILINTARGAIVNPDALVEALQTGKLASAALDVFPNEPTIPAPFIELKNLILTPHVGSNTFETRQAMAEAIIAVFQNFLRRPAVTNSPNLLNPEIYRNA